MLRHWPMYAIEGASLAFFMIAASAFTILLELPSSPVHAAIPDPMLRRLLMGLGMATTALVIIYSPFGAKTGAHLNPALTLTFARLGKIARADVLGYIAAQFAGGILGVALAGVLFGAAVGHPSVNFVATRPGAWGLGAAIAAEAAMTFVLMSTVLAVSNHPRWAPKTGLAAATLVALYITFEAPISGMSLNPARTLGPEAFAGGFATLWIYFVGPPLGMLLAAEVYARRHGLAAVRCAKLNHPGTGTCHFHCRFHEKTDFGTPS